MPEEVVDDADDDGDGGDNDHDEDDDESEEEEDTNADNSSALTKVDVKESGIGPFNKNFLWWSMECLEHEMNPISHHGPELLCILLKPTK